MKVLIGELREQIEKAIEEIRESIEKEHKHLQDLPVDKKYLDKRLALLKKIRLIEANLQGMCLAKKICNVLDNGIQKISYAAGSDYSYFIENTLRIQAVSIITSLIASVKSVTETASFLHKE
ncbi:hypothetical protein HYT26_04925 [Candidatus Pacearchaeota archaeon]|nr:hypothetical protein [Candidatus Pacearchaeota archaeon]